MQLSSYYAAEDGWFFRTNEDLSAQSLLSENLVRATLSTDLTNAPELRLVPFFMSKIMV